MFKKPFILEHGLALSWGIALIATLGSLYFSEIEQFVPCTYCWYQRILMYPLVIILGIAAIKNDYRVTRYVLPLSILGMLMSAFHYLSQKTEWFETSSSCGIVPCTFEYINWLGFITIPFLAFVAFTCITILQMRIRRAAQRYQ